METNTEFNINDIFNVNDETFIDINNLNKENIELTKEADKLTEQINNEFTKILDGEEKKEDDIYLAESLTDGKEICLGKEFEQELADSIIQFNMLKESIDEKKKMIKEFIENNQMGSFKTNLLNVKYVSATTTTSIDSTRLKKEMPDIAAKYSKVSAKSSSVSVGLIEDK